jgi:hypothetical protein
MDDDKMVWLLGVLVAMAAIGLLMLCRELQNAVLARKEAKEARTLVHKKPNRSVLVTPGAAVRAGKVRCA